MSKTNPFFVIVLLIVTILTMLLVGESLLHGKQIRELKQQINSLETQSK